MTTVIQRTYFIDIKEDDDSDKYKRLRRPLLTVDENKCFGSNLSISLEKSVVHVPFNVYAEDFNVVQGADFSSQLDKTFQNNLGNGQGRFNAIRIASFILL